MSSQCAPVFLGASCDQDRSLVRSALAAHPSFFTSHLPADDTFSVRSWAETMSATPFSRRPVWLSEAAFDCVDDLKRWLPHARFVRVVERPTRVGDWLLEIDAGSLRADFAGALARILEFLGEQTVTAQGGLRRCA